MLGIPLTTKAPLHTTILEIGWRLLNLQPDFNHNQINYNSRLQKIDDIFCTISISFLQSCLYSNHCHTAAEVQIVIMTHSVNITLIAD